IHFRNPDCTIGAHRLGSPFLFPLYIEDRCEMKREKEYKRMAGMRLFFSRASLWLGQDHVLVVKSQGYSEVYTRFYFNDIQGFLIYKTVTGKVLNIVWGLIAALFAGYCLEGIFVRQSDFASYANGFLGGVFPLLLIIGLAKGPTCRCY